MKSAANSHSLSSTIQGHHPFTLHLKHRTRPIPNRCQTQRAQAVLHDFALISIYSTAPQITFPFALRIKLPPERAKLVENAFLHCAKSRQSPCRFVTLRCFKSYNSITLSIPPSPSSLLAFYYAALSLIIPHITNTTTRDSTLK